VSTGRDDRRRAALAALAPGTELRDGLDRIVRGSTGALVVLGYDQTVEDLCSGGFRLTAEFSATRLRELAKMDGAIVLDTTGTTIVRAAVQLVPDPALPTGESGTRHRTAERVARQTGFPVISVSKSMRVIAVYTGGERHVLEDSGALLSRAQQALGTLDRYRHLLNEVAGRLSMLEIEDLVTVRDVAVVAQRLELVGRIADEITGYVVELGTDGRMLALQLDELVSGTGSERDLLVQDYAPFGHDGASASDRAQAALVALTSDDLLDLSAVAAALRFGSPEQLEAHVSPRGYRLLAKVPRLPAAAAVRLTEHFGSVQKLLSASAEELSTVGALSPGQARNIREGLSRLAESSLLDRYA
jgi:diadenylate cyclase